MSTVKLYANATAVIDEGNPSEHVTPGADVYFGTYKDVLLKFEQPNSSYDFKKILSCRLHVYGHVAFSRGPYVIALKSSWNAATVTYETRPDAARNVESIPHPEIYKIEWGANDGWDDVIPYGYNSDAIANGVELNNSEYHIIDVSCVYTSASTSYKPYLEIRFDDNINNHLEPTCSPRLGTYRNPAKPITLQWSNMESGSSVKKLSQVSAVVTWKETGGAETTINVTTAQSVTIPANTWNAASSYQWKVVVTDNGGTATDSGWATVSTTAAAATPPTLEFPISTSVDGSENITFRWVNNGGENNTGTDLEFSTDGTTWGDPINVAAGEAEHTVAAGTLSSGTHYWRARAYNADSAAGDWTDPAIFSVISAPAAPYYEVTNTPRPTISWVSDEQQAFQVQMGDYDSGLVFGTAQSFKCPVYLPNGSATVRVRVMNQYNLWSDWSGTQITIANTPGAASPVLTVTAGADAQLSWTDVGASRYLIYRNGELIGETDGLSFTDRYAIGQASYFVRAAEALTTQTIALTDDYYINTNSPSGYVKIDSPTAAADTWSYAQVACVEGDRFLVTATGSNSYHLAYTFAKSDKSKVAPTASANTGYTNEELTAPADAAWLVVNANMSNERSLKKIVHQAADYYTDSNTVSVTMAVPCTMICAMDGGWIELRYSTEPIYTSQQTHTQQVSMMVWSGAVYPEAEIGPHRQRSYQIDVAFRPGESAPFEALLGREVFLKDQYGARLHGVMAAISTARNRFYTVCSATLEEMEGSL